MVKVYRNRSDLIQQYILKNTESLSHKFMRHSKLKRNSSCSLFFMIISNNYQDLRKYWGFSTTILENKCHLISPPKHQRLFSPKPMYRPVPLLSRIKLILPALLFILSSMAPGMLLAVDNETLSNTFNNYEASTDTFILQMYNREWEDAAKTAQNLGRQSDAIYEMAMLEDIPVWKNYASNLRNHCLELEQAANQKDIVEATRLIAILISHIELIQSANPLWLDYHLSTQIALLENSIVLKDAEVARDAAEAIHTSATKIALSVMNAGNRYSHTRWLSNIQQINGLGDAILGEVNRSEWQNIPEQLFHIKHIVQKWHNSFLLHTSGQTK